MFKGLETGVFFDDFTRKTDLNPGRSPPEPWIGLACIVMVSQESTVSAWSVGKKKSTLLNKDS